MKLSIVVAAYNVEKFIEKCILTCMSQNIPTNNYEVICVDDGSTDNTSAILGEYRNKYSNFTLINQTNQGLGVSRNIGLKHAKGDFIWFIDGDDYVEVEILTEIIKKIDDFNLDTLVLNYNIVQSDNQLFKHGANDVKIDNNTITGSKFYRFNFSKSYSWSFVFKKSLFDNHHILFKEGINMQDSEILPRLLTNVERLSFLKRPCYNYVQHPNSFTNSNDGDKRLNYFKSIIVVSNSLKEFLKTEVKGNNDLKFGLIKKTEMLHQIVFNHLVYFTYDRETLFKVINLLKSNGFYPLRYNAKRKNKIFKIGLNNFPFLMNDVLNFLFRLKHYRR